MSTNKVSLFVVVAYIIALFAMMSVPFPTTKAAPVVKTFTSTGTEYSVPAADRAYSKPSYKGSEDQPLVHCMGSALVATQSFVWYCIVPPAQGSPIVVAEKVIETIDAPVVVDAPIMVIDTPVVVVETPVVNTPAPVVDVPAPVEEKVHCNKGEGNGGEGCDPGNHPEKGNNDED